MAFLILGCSRLPSSVSQDSRLIAGVGFKKTFSYAGFEMQPKKYQQPKIALLNIELELKAEKENAELRIENVEVYMYMCTCALLPHTCSTSSPCPASPSPALLPPYLLHIFCEKCM